MKTMTLILVLGLPGLLWAVSAKKMEFVMGTLLEIRVEAKDSETAEGAVQAALDEARRWDRLLSNYKGDSEISRINDESYPESTETTGEMIRFLVLARDLSEETLGYFDVMVEPLSRLWGLRGEKLKTEPEKKKLNKATVKSSSRYLEIYTTDNSVRFLTEEAGIDTGGIGKGYAMDRALEVILPMGLESVTFNFGGEILFWSEKFGERTISVRDPQNPDRIWKTLDIAGFPSELAAVSTSGNYERPGHLLNPMEGNPVEGPMKSVTVVSRSAARADALSTALFVMGPIEAIQFSESQARDWILLLYSGKEGKILHHAAGKWKDQLITDYANPIR